MANTPNAKIVREKRDHHGKPMQTFTINGKKIKTNLGCWQDCMWNGNKIPARYQRCHRVDFGESMDEVFEDAIANGYDEIRFVQVSTCIRGYHKIYAWLHRTEK